jgi:phosphoesterase RecJ-like protein
VIGTHIDPDCDGICSALAVSELVKRLNGSRPVMFCHSSIPPRYYFLLGKKRFSRKIVDHDMLILVDSADITRVFPRNCEGAYGDITSRFVVNIDHHKSNDQFGDIAIIDEHASSTCEMVYGFFKDMKIPLSDEIADIIFSGIYNETGGFVYPNTTARTLGVCGELVAAGVRPAVLVKQLNSKSVPGTLLLSSVLNTIKVRRGIGTMHITQAMIRQHKAQMADSENFISFLQAIEGVRVSVFLRQESDGIRISLRSDGLVDVNKLARKFGGGGHRLAAGVRMDCELQQAERKIVSAMIGSIRKRR